MQAQLKDEYKWNQLRQGNDIYFSMIYSESAPRLYRYGLKFTQNRDTIEDVVQDLFSDLIKNRETLGETDNILFYLMRAFKRRLFRILKKEINPDVEPLADNYSFRVTYSIEQEIIKNEEIHRQTLNLFGALEQLPVRQKEAIYLKYREGMNYHEIADIMEISIESSRNLVCKAIKSLRQSIHTPTQLIQLLNLILK
ncbi:RNA polymerase sigma factor [Sunxiuqinia elliptica]|uniref:RNA polymerase sigma factor (Sigma-70 family) n=1 Tax=Sunxiuqinia elliptica TaxID=655355 RepID=A0A4R6GP95_9BACT|nr:sigma-70 family RNA polymerase sigma factor [Sunxiuqinia elliptica]TDN97092.1 RNA polymerase sigma factor (sigma-70 family) [Sunxiuqinia elliptica]TDO60723.1 RNA polymerase sigma factor (sigma-70 family) [Sunxiuqinia elliptica]